MTSDNEFMEKLNARALKDLIRANARKRKIIKGAFLEKIVARILKKKGYKVDRIKTSQHAKVDVIGRDSKGNVKVVVQCTNFEEKHWYDISGAKSYEAQLWKYPSALWIAVCSHRESLTNIDSKVKDNMIIVVLGFDIEARMYHPKGKTKGVSLSTYRAVKRKVWNRIPHV